MAALGPAVVAEPASASGTTTTPRFLRAPDSLEALTARRRHAAIERNIGWGLAGAGMATAAVGVTLLGSSRVASLGYEEGAAYQLGGVLALSVGVLVLIPGVVLGLHGENAISDADGRLGALKQARVSSPRIHLTPLFAWLPGGAFAGAHLRF